MIIGICGLIGSGKGTVADMLERDHGFTKISFADSLKDCVAGVFGWDRRLLEGDTNESRAWREQVDSWWANRLGMPNLTPRWVLQYWGTEVCRRGFHNDIWILSIERKIRDIGQANVVIPDTRFPNEMAAIRGMGGKVWRISRGPSPDWLERYESQGIEPQDVHESEWRWVRGEFDATISNDGTVDQLAEAVRSRMGDQ